MALESSLFLFNFVLVAVLQVYTPCSAQSIDQIITNAATSPEAFDYIQDDSGTVKVELDMLFTAAQWEDLQRLNSSGIEDIRTRRKAVRKLNLRWTEKTVPYEITTHHFKSFERRIIQAALDDWERYTCIQFRPVKHGDSNWILFQSGDGCSSFVGMGEPGQGPQTVSLGPGCRQKGVIIHEIGHAIGYHHEQSRPDRDEYVSILTQNVPANQRHNFNKYTTAVINTYLVPYDYSSVMHYGGTAFSTDDSRTIVTKDPRYQDVIGNRKGHSFRDIQLANRMYNCADNCPETSCPGEGFVGKDCKCWCPGKPVKLCGGGGVVRTTSKTRTTTPDGCIDSNRRCSHWASNGECQKSSEYMLVYCKRSCKSCGNNGGAAPCRDDHKHCSHWAGRGYCGLTSYADYMRSTCKKSCKVCPSSYSVPVASVCVNSHQSCGYWATKGECYKNPAYMLATCKKSCKVCRSGKYLTKI